jgi:FlaA1/EpsC-like NDP-sugar epimerase
MADRTPVIDVLYPEAAPSRAWPRSEDAMFQVDLLKGKRILVTGGGTGLGRSMSHRFLELGANVVICAGARTCSSGRPRN